MSTIDTMKERILLFEQNPTTIIQPAFDLMSEVSNGEKILLDPTNPFIYSIETSVAFASAAMDKDDVNLRKLYPRLATSYADLYNHMSDDDFLNRFSRPATNGEMILVIPINELENAAIDDGTGNKKIVIPGDSEWEVNGTKYYQHYPVNILLQPGGSYQVFFDLSVESPIKRNISNIINWSITNIENRPSLQLNIPVDQLALSKEEYIITDTTGFSVVTPFTDQFFYARAYIRNDLNEWEEIRTTHSQQVYDATLPTVVLTVEEGMVISRVPEIYITNGRIRDTLRIDIFTTKGEIEQDLGVLAPEAFSVRWFNFSERDVRFTSLMARLGTFLVFSLSTVRGGSNSISFEQLRSKIIYGTDDQRAPIKFEELENKLNLLNYQVTPLEDHVLGRTYLATRAMETINTTLFSRMTNDLLTFRIDTQRTDLADSLTVKPERTVIKPNALFERTPATVVLHADATTANILNLDKEVRIETLNSKDYFFTPFFTVLDETDNTFEVRSYFLDNPNLVTRSFIDNNAELGYVVNTKSMTITRSDTGFNVTIVAGVPAGVEDLSVQLVFKSSANGERWHAPVALGDVIGTQATFDIDLVSDFDITKQNQILISNVSDNNGNVIPVLLDLLSEIDIAYVVDTPAKITTLFDDRIADALHSNTVTAVTLESGMFEFGRQLEALYSEGRPIQTTPEYERYPADEPELWTEVVFAKEPDGSIIFTTDNSTVPPTINPTVLHAIGDPVLDAQGDPVFLHRAGDIKRVAGEPILVTPARIEREVRLPMFNAIFKFTDTLAIQNYLADVPKDVLRFIETDIDPVANSLIERSSLPFSPSNTFSLARAVTAEENVITVNTSLEFAINITMTQASYLIEAARDQAKIDTLSALATALQRKELTLLDINQRIKAAVGDEVIGVSINTFLPDGDYVKLLNSFDEFSIKPRLVLRSNGEIDVEDSVTFSFTRQL